MQRRALLGLVLIWLLGTAASAIPASFPATMADSISKDGQTVRLLVGTSHEFASEWARSHRSTTVQNAVSEELAKINVQILDVPAAEASQMRKELKKQPGVRFAQIDAPVEALDLFPNDPDLSAQYGLINIRAPQGWEISTGSPIVTIAIVDSGVDFTHPDLVTKILAGYDFIEDDTLPQDEYGHGTHVAGIAAAATNNGQGVAGVSWGAQLLPVRVLNSTGSGSYSILAAGIVWAADHGAQIINLSLGGLTPDSTLLSAVNYAINRGCLLVAASGNDASGFLRYPAAFPVVVSVGSTNSINQRSGFSNYGSGLDLMAPGEAIYSTNTGGGYFFRTGTSMSVSYVSGLAAVLWGRAGATTPHLVEIAMEQSALDLGPAGWDAEYGFGLIQMDRALLYANQVSNTKTPTTSYTGGLVNMTATPISAFTSTPMVTLEAIIDISPSATSTTDEVSASQLDGTATTVATDIKVTLTATPASKDAVASAGDNQYLLVISGAFLVLGGAGIWVALLLWRRRGSRQDRN